MSGRNQNGNGDSGLFGIVHSNRGANKHFGKNSFNSSFPASVACYMMDRNILAIYNRLVVKNGDLRIEASEISLSDVFNCDATSLDQLSFHFESRYEPYQQYSFDTIDGIDLVVKHIDERFLAPLEVKLTVLPDMTTCDKTEDLWGCEMVVRSATTSYCALGMFDSVKKDATRVREIFEDACADVGSWVNDYEMSDKTPLLSKSINEFQKQYLKKQKPLVMQTIWKTQGQSPLLAENAFDIVVWSDYAFSRLFIDNALDVGLTMSRPMRASARLARCLWELSKSGKIRLAEIYRQMAFGKQTDKEFAISGQKWRSYVSSDRITKPILKEDVIDEIIKPEHLSKLKPERRFDQTLFFTARK